MDIQSESTIDLTEVDHFCVATVLQVQRRTKSRDQHCSERRGRGRSTCFTCRNLNLLEILINIYD